ncbi:hypothetical protein DFJ58DRAFT_817827 [Suillus subalutaceus]|uniref:uncharacterized protein n=1 Tax=Suillus subalutaceus TaxID=48586 RepID=UPI001B8732CD|nr:uncharacterized protein DFJ58DRAFT_817827 [Suillus subalutaceus]KAG1836738.1 hypothetical protein DFJ58DRAFT_817827 [Suillus subalutaceus]
MFLGPWMLLFLQSSRILTETAGLESARTSQVQGCCVTVMLVYSGDADVDPYEIPVWKYNLNRQFKFIQARTRLPAHKERTYVPGDPSGHSKLYVAGGKVQSHNSSF